MDFEELVERIFLRLKAIAVKLDGRYTLFDEDDLLQEALTHLWCQYKEGILYDKTDSFILQSCYYFLRNYIRRSYKKIDRNLVSINIPFNGKENTFEDILPVVEKETLLERVELNLLRGKMHRLFTSREEKVFSLYMEGLTTREIGKRVGISHVMVVKIKKRIKDKCQHILK
jgi:RNA polymerase sigma factor (sigma-70 family)